MNEDQIKKYFQKNQWYLTRNQLEKININQYDLKKLLTSQKITKLTHGVYRWAKVNFDSEELFDISHIQPEGVFCLNTALNFYNLTSFMPKMYYFVIPRQNRIKRGLEQYPLVIKKWTTPYFNLGITQFKIGKFSIRMYDIEKSICDSIRYRNELGLFIIKEILTAYLRSPNRNIQKLNKYAQMMRVDKPMKDFIGMII